MLGSFQCRGVLLLWHMVGQGPAVLAAGARRVGCLYPRHLCRGIYSFRLSVCLFIHLYVLLYVRSFVRSFVLPSHLWNYFKVLPASNLSGVYLTNHSSESIHIWTIGTLEGRLSFHDSSPQGPCPRVGLEIKI